MYANVTSIRYPVVIVHAGGQTHATVMTAIAAKLNDGTTVSVITNLYNEQERMLIYANSTVLNFTDPNMNWMQFPGANLFK